MVAPMDMGGGGQTLQTHRTNVLAPFLQEGFGYKKDTAWYVRTARLLEIWDDVNKNLAYKQQIFNNTKNTIYTHLIKDKKWQENVAVDYLERFSRKFKKLYYGPGVAYVVQVRKRAPPELIYSTVGWLEMRPMTEAFIDPDDDTGLMRIRTQSFKIEILRCQHFNTENCMCLPYLQEYGPHNYTWRKCLNCPLRKKAEVHITNSGFEAPRGVTVNFQNKLLLNARKELEEMWGTYEKHMTNQLSIPGPLKAPEWSEFAGMYYSDKDDDLDPNEKWQEKIPMNPMTEWMKGDAFKDIPDYGDKYRAWLKSKGIPITKHAVFEKSTPPTYPVEEGDVPVVETTDEAESDETQTQ